MPSGSRGVCVCGGKRENEELLVCNKFEAVKRQPSHHTSTNASNKTHSALAAFRDTQETRTKGLRGTHKENREEGPLTL